MPKAVLTTKVDPSYDDLPEERYHFPRTYLNAARAALGDWIVYYEPRRSSARLSSSGGRQSYFATARIVRVDGDPRRADHYYAYVEDYLEFDRPVPFREDGFFYESGLQKEDGSVNKGRFGRAVRLLDDAEYSLILAAGFETGTAERERFGTREGVHPDPGRLELTDRPIIERLSRRPISRPGVLHGDQAGLRQHLRDQRSQDHQRRRAGRSPGRAHPARARQWTGQPPERRRAELHLSLDVRPRPDLDRRRLQPAVQEERRPRQRAVAGEPRPAPASAGAGDLPAASAVPGVSSGACVQGVMGAGGDMVNYT